jgi:hypothetical protein
MGLKPKIVVEIDEDNVTVEVQGMSGPGCKALTKELEDGLGTKVSDKTKPEFHHKAQQGQSAVQEG